MKVVAQHFDIVEVLFVVVKMEKKAFAVLSGAFGEVCVGKNLILYKIFYHDYYYLGTMLSDLPSIVI